MSFGAFAASAAVGYEFDAGRDSLEDPLERHSSHVGCDNGLCAVQVPNDDERFKGDDGVSVVFEEFARGLHVASRDGFGDAFGGLACHGGRNCTPATRSRARLQ